MVGSAFLQSCFGINRLLGDISGRKRILLVSEFAIGEKPAILNLYVIAQESQPSTKI